MGLKSWSREGKKTLWFTGQGEERYQKKKSANVDVLHIPVV